MRYCKITAIIRPACLEVVEQKLKKLCVPGISVAKVNGYGEHKNFFNSDWKSAYARIEVFIEADRAYEVSRGIMEMTHTGKAGDGIVAVLPVETIYRIRDKQAV